MKAAFPVSLGEVDPAWLTDVLRANRLIAQGEKVDGFEASPIGLGFGQTGESARLTLRYARSETSTKAPASLFAKFATTDPVRRKASKAIGLYQREVNFYNVLVKAASVRAPACYFAETTGEGEFFALLLEDFPNHRPGDETVGLKVEEARLAIDLMAQLHGPYWGKMAKVDLAPLVMPARDRYVVAWNEMEARFGEHVPDCFREAREVYLDAIVPLQQWLISQPSMLGHGDLRLDNLLFGHDGDLVRQLRGAQARQQRRGGFVGAERDVRELHGRAESRRLHQMQPGLVAAVQPGAGETERRPVAAAQAHDFAEQPSQRRAVAAAQVDVVEAPARRGGGSGRCRGHGRFHRCEVVRSLID